MIEAVHFSDPGCPWAWSASPSLTVLRWRYGDQLRWRHVMIGLTRTGREYDRRGYTGRSMALGYRSFRRRGMPFAVAPRERVHGTWPMCRAVVAARLTVPEREWAVFRALQVAQFTTTHDLESEDGIALALERVPGLDVPLLLAAAADRDTEEAFGGDRREARSAAGSATQCQGKAATTPEGAVRYTAPSVVFTTEDGRRLEAGGFQPLEAYDVLIANLDPSLRRRAVAEDAGDVLQAFPDGLTTVEVAAAMTPNNASPDVDAAEDALIALAAAGAATRDPIGNDAIWTAAGVAAGRALRAA